MDLDLSPGAPLLIDSSAFIYLIEGEASSPRRAAVERFLAAAAQARTRLVASTIAWAELLERPLAAKDEERAIAYRRLLSGGSVELLVVDVAVAERAAVIRAALPQSARRSLSDADAIQIATAVEHGARAILTNDEAWRAAPDCPPLFIVDELAFQGD
jgi:predicted nucleic acid-binding protein